jgi:hypothetical protein
MHESLREQIYEREQENGFDAAEKKKKKNGEDAGYVS